MMAMTPGAMLCAQDSTSAEGGQTDRKTITVIPDPVVLAVVVRDKKGGFVQGLEKGDFTLSVRDKPQTIMSVDHGGDVPLTVGIVVDVNRGLREKMPALLDDERSAAAAFFEGMLKPAAGAKAADSGFVVQFVKQIELLQDVTDDRAKLNAGLKELGTESSTFKATPEPDTVDSEGRKVRGGGTSLYDSLFLCGDELMANNCPLCSRRALRWSYRR